MADRIVTEMVPVLGAPMTEKSKNTTLDDFAFASPDKHFTHVTKIWSDEEMKKCNGNFGPPLVVAAGASHFVVGRCCAEDACVKEQSNSTGRVGDPMKGAYSVIKKAKSDLSGWDDST